MKLYPYDIPDGWHPLSWILFGFGLTPEQIRAAVPHLVNDLGMRPTLDTTTKSYAWAVGLSGDYPDRERAEVGDTVDIQVAEQGAVRLSGGAPPPGVRLDKPTGKLSGTLTHPGLYSVTVTIGPAVKYDPLGSPGGPGDPGMWIPIDQPRQEPITNLSTIPLSIAQLSDRDKDHALAELMAWADGVTIKEADSGD